MLTKASEYAFRALHYLASASYQGERVSISQIAKAIASPEAFTAKVMQQLVRKGLVHSVKGVQGGYELSREQLYTVKLADVIIAMEGEDFTSKCILGLAECSNDHPCALHLHVQAVKNRLHTIFQETSLNDLVTKNLEVNRLIREN